MGQAITDHQVKIDTSAIQPEGAVIYADAGVRPVNPGFGGWGYHGYTYSMAAPKKPMGPHSLTLSPTGYVPRSDKKPEVTPIKYFDAFGTIPHASNNGAEVLAAAAAMESMSRYQLKNLLIRADSQYVITGAMQHLPGWKANGWQRRDGSPLANLEHWKLLDRNMAALRDQGTTVSFEWVKGHNGDQGNEMADKYATIAALMSGGGHSKQCTQLSEPAEYWKDSEDSHPLVTTLPSMLFLTNPDTLVKGEYYLSSMRKDIDMLGKRMADGSFAYLRLETPDPYIELVQTKQMSVSAQEDSIVLVRLDELFKPTVRKDLMLFGQDVLVPASRKTKHSQNLGLAGSKSKADNENEPVSQRLNPPLIAIRAMEAVNFLKGMFLTWKSGEAQAKGLIVTDITDVFFDNDKKTGKKLKAEISPTASVVPVKSHLTPMDPVLSTITCGPDVLSNKTLGEPAPMLDLELILDTDIPSRNVFKKLEKLEPKVTLLVWKEADKAYRYATIIEAKGAQGIWCGYYTNYKFLS